MYYDVLLVNPPLSSFGKCFEHLGLGYIAACLRKKDITAGIIDIPVNQWSLSHAINEIRKISCKLIGISIPFQDGAEKAFSFINSLKKTGFNAHFTIGGIYPTFAYEEIMNMFPAIDSVVLGEGEETLVELAENLINNGNWRNTKGIAYRCGDIIIKNDARPLIENLDSLPFPERDTLPQVLKRLNFAAMLTSRGCYGRCSFCSVAPFFSSFGPKYRYRSTDNIMEEIEYLYNRYNVRNISFNDASFIGGKGRHSDRVRDIAEEILKKDLKFNFFIQCRVDDVDLELFSVLKRAGLNGVYIGIESGSQTMLDRFKKDVRVEDNIKAIELLSKLDIYISMGFIMFDDKTDMTDFNNNIEFIKKVKEIVPKGRMQKIYISGKVLPFAGTEIEKIMKETNKYKGNTINFDYDIENSSVNMLYKSLKGLELISLKMIKILNLKDNWEKKWLKAQQYNKNITK